MNQPLTLFGIPESEDGLAPKCPHPKTETRRKTISNGAEYASVQCLTCGKNIRFVPKDSVPFIKLLPFDEELESKGKQRVEEFYKKRSARFEHNRQNHIGQFWEQYNAYLDSDHWHRIRQQVISRDPWCQVCFENTSTQAHHLSYECFKKYGISFTIECIGVCKSCHDRLHGKEDKEDVTSCFVGR